MILKNGMIASIRFYQKHISPYKGYKCPYIPTCSQYGIEAIRMHGPLKGGLLALWRILRCNPFSRGGYDPVRPPASFEETGETETETQPGRHLRIRADGAGSPATKI